ncbi:MAG: lipid II flippase MurJ, partial [Bosea sp. (in: a-proteobacteria)]
VLLAEPIISILFERGKFGAIDRERTSAALAAFAIGLPFAVAAKVFAQVFFARQAPRIALYAGLSSLLVAILVGHMLVLKEPATGAALAASLAFATQMSVLVFFLLRQRLWHLSVVAARKIAGVILASLVMAMVLSALMMMLESWLVFDAATFWRIASLALLCLSGLVSYAICARLFGAFRMRELDEFRHHR